MTELNEMARRLSELEKEYDEFIVQVKNLGYQSIEEYRPNNSDEEFMKKHLLAIRREIDDHRQRYVAELTRSLESTSKNLEATTAKLKDSTDSQVGVIKDVKASSERLERLTVSLMFLTAILAVMAASSYVLQSEVALNVTGDAALGYATVGGLFVLAFFAVILRGTRKRHRLDP